MTPYEALPWDSDFFGFSIGRIDDSVPTEELGKAVAAADADRVQCVYLLCPGNDDQRLLAAIDLGFRPYDVRVELGHGLDGFGGAATELRRAAASDEAALDEIARTRMTGTRFWNDRHFPRERVADLYSAWLKRGLTTAPVRRTLVSGESDGFVLCHFDRDAEVGSIELIAVAAGVERRGLGASLVAGADHAFVEAGLARATVVTQGRNIAAQRLYQRCGYRTIRSDTWLHRWTD